MLDLNMGKYIFKKDDRFQFCFNIKGIPTFTCSVYDNICQQWKIQKGTLVCL